MSVTHRSKGLLVLAVVLVCGWASNGSARVFAGAVGHNVQTILAGGHPVPVEQFNPSIQGRRPAVIILHGADGMAEFGRSYREAATQLAQAGYVAFLPHYLDEVGITESTQFGPQMFLHWMQVVNDTFRFAAAQPNVDPRRIAIGGFSLGGFLAVATGATNPQVAAVVEFFGGMPGAFAANVQRMPPTLILHGCEDNRVPVGEAYALAQLLQGLGTPYQIFTYPGQGHIFTGEVKEDAAKKVLAFLDCYL
jgi:dienelactone hydrolase